MIFKDFKYFEQSLYYLFDKLSSVTRNEGEDNQEFIDRARYNTSAGLIVMDMLHIEGGAYSSDIVYLSQKSSDFTLDLTIPYQEVEIAGDLTIDFTGFDGDSHFVVLQINSVGNNVIDFVSDVDNGWVTEQLSEISNGSSYILAIYLQNNRDVQNYADINIGYAEGVGSRSDMVWDFVVGFFDHDSHQNVNVSYDSTEQKIILEVEADEEGGTLHPRQHNVDNSADHAADSSQAGRMFVMSEPNGEPTLVDIETEVVGEGEQVFITKDYSGSKFTFGLNQEYVDHNSLLNYQANRHKKFVYSDVLKCYVVEA